MAGMVVSIVGRPNVGKSSLFNALMGKQNKALTYDMAGVTRDRHYGVAKLDELVGEQEVILVDTGGFFPQGEAPGLFEAMTAQAKVAALESDLILLVVDVRDGPSPFDKPIADFVRKQKKDFWLVVNKCDDDKQADLAVEFFSLGVPADQVYPVSCAHARGIRDLRARLQQAAMAFAPKGKLQTGITPMGEVAARVALIGAPNVGKSTLLNKLLGAERALVSDVPGTTVDPIEGYFNLALNEAEDGEGTQSIALVDTAGIRKKSSIKGYVEEHSVYRSLRAISEADTVLYLIEARKGFTHQDKRLIDIALEKGKAVILCLNKMDLLEITSEGEKKEWLNDIRWEIPWLNFCDLVPMCARDGKGIKALKGIIRKTLRVRSNTISTSQLNREVSALVARHPVVIKGSGGKHLKIKYAFQVKTSPPTFVLYGNRIRGIPDSYKRYLKSGLRESFKLDNSPIHLIFRTGKEKQFQDTIG